MKLMKKRNLRLIFMTFMAIKMWRLTEGFPHLKGKPNLGKHIVLTF